MKGLDTVGIVGLGLVGGSLARALSSFRTRIVAYDCDRGSLRAAKRAGIVDVVAGEDLREFDSADVIVIAVPVDAACDVMRRIERHASNARLVTDVGSTKCGIVAAAAKSSLAEKFVGSHPMAGDHRSGWSASRPDLFLDAPVYLCPTDRASADALDAAQWLWSAVGAATKTIDAREHDARVAWTSHMPHFISTAIAVALDGAGIGGDELGPGGRSMTRLAAGPAAIWSAIGKENAESIGHALAAVEAEIEGLREDLRTATKDELETVISRGTRWARRERENG